MIKNIIRIITVVLTAMVVAVSALFAYTNQAYFPNSKGEVVQAQVVELTKMVTEIRSDVKTLIRGQS